MQFIVGKAWRESRISSQIRVEMIEYDSFSVLEREDKREDIRRKQHEK